MSIIERIKRWLGLYGEPGPYCHTENFDPEVRAWIKRVNRRQTYGW